MFDLETKAALTDIAHQVIEAGFNPLSYDAWHAFRIRARALLVNGASVNANNKNVQHVTGDVSSPEAHEELREIFRGVIAHV